MKVLVVGFPKTGTKTMNAVLRILGYSLYDYEDNFYYLGKQWTKILTKGGTKEDFYEMYKDIDATMDIPATIFWEEILEAFPNCKLIFMKRKSEEQWERSRKEQTRKIDANPTIRLLSCFSPTARAMYRYSHHVFRVVYGASSAKFTSLYLDISSTVTKKRYRDHNTCVLTRAPRAQLLEFSLSDGWEPLCKFLGKPIPDAEFPHQNKGGILVDHWLKTSPVFHQMKREMKISVSVLVGLAGILSYFAYSGVWRSWIPGAWK